MPLEDVAHHDRHLHRHRLRAQALAHHAARRRQKSAPTRSILLTKAMRGTPYLSAWRQTVSDCGSTPPTPQKTAIAPSRTRSDRSTSTVKSTWPGVSMMLIWWSVQTAGRGRRGDRDPALPLLLHPVHGGGAVVHLAHAMDPARVEEDPLGQGGLAGIDVGHDPDVAQVSLWRTGEPRDLEPRSGGPAAACPRAEGPHGPRSVERPIRRAAANETAGDLPAPSSAPGDASCATRRGARRGEFRRPGRLTRTSRLGDQEPWRGPRSRHGTTVQLSGCLEQPL